MILFRQEMEQRCSWSRDVQRAQERGSGEQGQGSRESGYEKGGKITAVKVTGAVEALGLCSTGKGCRTHRTLESSKKLL